MPGTQTKSLGKYIATRRNAMRLTQEEVVERLRRYGVDRAAPTLANWEAGRQAIPIENIPALSRALEVSPVTLYEYAGVLAELPGREIIKLLDGLSDEELIRLEKVIRAVLETA